MVDKFQKMAQKGATITFGDVSETYVGMNKQGRLHEKGFDLSDLQRIGELFGDKAELYDLRGLMNHSNIELDEAYILIIRNPFPDLVEPLEDVMLCDEEKFDDEGNLTGVEWDKKKISYGSVVNSHARYNLCFSRLDSEIVKDSIDLSQKKGTVYNIRRIQALEELYQRIAELDVGELEVEGNFYYDLNKTYISFHRDKERKKVIGYRLGDRFPFHVRWHHNGTPVSEHATVFLERGDMYIMTDFTCGYYLMKNTGLCIKHAAGYAPIIFKEGKKKV